MTTLSSVGIGVVSIVLLILASSVVAVILRFATRKWPLSTVNEVAPPPSSISFMLDALRTIVRFAVAPTGVMLMFVLLNQDANWNWESLTIFDQGYDVLRPPAERAKVANVTQNSTAILVSNSTANRPAWTQQQQQQISSDVTRMVLSSRLWSTAAEAENELRVKATEMLRADFDHRHHSWLDPKALHCLSESRIVDAAVKDRYLERIEQDFGTFSSPMNRLWWQVEISPIVRTELYDDWRLAVVKNRVFVLGAALSFATMAFSAIGMFAALHGLSRSRRFQFFGILAGTVLLWCGTLLSLTAALMK